MKRIVFMLLAMLLMASVFCFATSAREFYADEDGLYTVELQREPNNDYTIVAMKGLYDVTNYLEAYASCVDEDLIYFDQKSSDENGKVVFGPFAPMGYFDATLLLGGTDIAEPVLAGHLSAEGIKNDASITIGGVLPTYTVNGAIGEDIVIELFANAFDSFGYPALIPVDIEFLVEGSDDIYFDSESAKITIDKNASVQSFTITAVSENANDSIVVNVLREASKAYRIKFYSDDTYSEEITQIEVIGVDGDYPTTQVYAKLYDQFGESMQNAFQYTFNYTATTTNGTFKPSGVGTFPMIVTTEDMSVMEIISVVVTNRPAYTGSALELYNLINDCKAELKNVGKTVFISTESGKDIYPDSVWITTSVESTFKTAIASAETILTQYEAGVTQNSVVANTVTRLNNAKTTFKNAAKPGVRIDITNISITIQNVRLGINGSDKETIDLSKYVIVDNTDHTDKLTWSTSNDEFVKVTDKGLVSTGKNGTAVVSVTTRTGLSASTTVTTYTKINRIEMSPSSLTATYGGEDKYFTVSAYPLDQTDILIWESSDPEVAIIEASADGLKGKVIPLKNGNATITVTVASSVGTTRVIQKSRTVTAVMPDWDTVATPKADAESGMITTGTKVTL